MVISYGQFALQNQNNKEKKVEKKQKDIAKQYFKDPVLFTRKILGSEVWDRQADILRAVRDHKEVYVPSCHASGKSYIAARAVLWYLLTHKDSIVVTTSVTNRQVETILWGEIRSAVAKMTIPIGKGIEPLRKRLEIDDKWFAFGFATDSADAFQGIHSPYVMVVADEANGLTEEVWNGIEAVLVTGQCRLLAIGNPTEANTIFHKRIERGQGCVLPISGFDVPGVSDGDTRKPIPGLITREWIDNAALMHGEDSDFYRSRVLGLFPESQAISVIPASWLHKAFDRWRDLQEAGELPTPTKMGVDVGGETGLDPSEVALGTDTVLTDFISLGYRNEMEVVAKIGQIRGLLKSKDGTITIDANGIGSGVYSRCRELGMNAIPIHSQSAVKDLRTNVPGMDQQSFLNVRAAMWWHLRCLLSPVSNVQIAIKPDEEFEEEVTAPVWWTTSSGKIQIESKKDIHSRIKRSTNKADAAVQKFWGRGPRPKLEMW